MTKICVSCGGAFSEAHPYRICPKCLSGHGPRSNEPPEPATPQAPSGRFTGALQRLVRRDFFQKYDLQEKIGQGGQGDIWKVWDFEFRRQVAMKRLSVQDAASEPVLYRFLAEAQIASQLQHPGILPIFDVGLDPDGRPFYTTQLLPGTTLADVWREVNGGRPLTPALSPDGGEGGGAKAASAAASPSPPSGERAGVRGPPPTGTEKIPDTSESSSQSTSWSLPRALGLLERVCDVMAHAHDRGVVHRDLKPSNILVGAFGDVRVIDWGSAQVLPNARQAFEETFVPLDERPVETDRADALRAAPSSPLATSNSGQPLTMLFVPPEILEGQSDQLGPETDVYSVGVMLHELLSGRLPYSRPDGSLPGADELKQLILAGPPEPLRRLDRSISRDLAAICEKAMARPKARRYRTMQELAEDLRAAQETRPVQARPGRILKAQKFLQRHISYVLLGGLALIIAAISFPTLHQLKSERDTARRTAAMSEGERAVRSGRWRDALARWDDAEAAGYADSIQLGLLRSEAWVVLHEKTKAKAELDKLIHRTDLGPRRGAVLLRVGEHQMYDRTTFDRGVEHVKAALSNELNAADRFVAKGLLAESVPESLEDFKQALKLDPYHHSAHRHSLGLEFVLGRHDEVTNHLNALKLLFPGEFSPGFIEAANLALLGRLEEAQASLAGLADKASPELVNRFQSSLRLLANAADSWDVNVWLGERTAKVSHSELVAAATTALSARSNSPSANGLGHVLPQLPCVNQGIKEGFDGIKNLVLPMFGNQEKAIAQIKSSWRRHPEALFPFFAATQLDSRHPRQGPRSLPLLTTQAELYQMGADSPSIVPTVQRLSLLLAVEAQTELALSSHTNATAMRTVCVANMRRVAFFGDMSAAECRFYAKKGIDLKEYDLAVWFLTRWEFQKPGDESAQRSRVRLAFAFEEYGTAMKRLDQMLAANPNDRWAAAEKKKVLEKINQPSDSIRQPANAESKP